LPIRVGLPYQPYSFLIRKLDGLIIAQDQKGSIRFSGTDASAVIQSAIDALTNGGTLFVGLATYVLSSAITLKPKVNFICECREVTFDASGLTGPAIKIDPTLPRVEGIEISNFTLKLGSGVTHGMKLEAIRDCLLRNIRITDLPSDAVGIQLEGTEAGTASFNMLQGVWISGAPGVNHTGIKLTGLVGSRAHGNVLIKPEVNGGINVGIHFHLGSDNLLILPVLRNLGTGVWFETFRNNAVGGFIEGCTTGINFDGNWNHWAVRPNFAGNTTNYVDTGIRNVRDWSTHRNRGTATISAGSTSVTVAHGLANTPTNVLVTPRADVGNVWVSARDATNITRSCSTAPATDVIVDWYAEV